MTAKNEQSLGESSAHIFNARQGEVGKVGGGELARNANHGSVEGILGGGENHLSLHLGRVRRPDSGDNVRDKMTV